MANTRELRRRIKSVKNTSQITKAMQMVAATKMRKAQMQTTNGRPYAENLSASLQKFFYQKSIVDEDKKAIIKIIEKITLKKICQKKIAMMT